MRWLSLTVAVVAVQHLAWMCAFGLGEEPSFSRHIQPIFAEHCLQCHGRDSEQREADLRLDVEESAKENAIVAGRPDDSALMERLTSDDPEFRMPPGKAKSLHATQIELIRQWIGAGANYESHWAYQPIAAAEPHEDPGDVEEQLSDIDRFVVARLSEQNLHLSKPATRQQLIRRATFDLTGLPPTWAEVTDFVNDPSDRAFEKVVDCLLESPSYGERWGRHWLDIARYADTHGGAAIGFKKFAFSYTYRDYVIAAFNKDLPYDQFVIEQIAADQLGLEDNAVQLAALGFLTVGMQFRNPHDTIDDQIDVVTRGLMGLTVSCARCHDHKFDAVSTKDYYSLYATFASSQVPDELPLVGAPETTDQFQQYQAELERLKMSLSDMAREQSEVMRGRLRMQVGLYLREIAKGAPLQDLSTTDIFSYRTDDVRPPVLQRWQRYMQNMSEVDAVFGPWVKLSKLEDQDFADQCQQLVETSIAENSELEKDLQKLSAAAPRWNPRVLDALASKKPASMVEVADAYGDLFAEVNREWLRALLEVSLEGQPGKHPIPDEDPRHLAVNSPVNRQLRTHLYGPDTPTNMDDGLASRMLNRPINDNLNGRRGAIHDLNLNSPGSPPRAMALREEQATPSFYVFQRGNPINRGDSVTARFLTAMGGSDDQTFSPGKRRLSLAKAIVDPANPLTRRVVVNWVWQRHFGKGLVRTPDDFGTRGEPPTHPELLDYLATRLLDDGWSLKKLHRRIMLSAVYQQASSERLAARDIDPENALLWRMPRRRLELEAMRDAMLVASGELTPDMGGRPFELLSEPTVPRRSIYAFVNRDIVDPILSIFDGANPNACTAMRPETTVPQQTLFALNSDFIQDRAAVMASTLVCTSSTEYTSTSTQSTTFADNVQKLYRHAFSRDPDEEELAVAVAYVQSALDNGEKNQVIPWQRLAHVLLAANEFVFVD